MKFLATVLFLAMLFVMAPEAQALTNDWGGYENDWSMPTGTSYKGPKATTCMALKNENQACRSCVPQYDDDGQPTGYIVCGFVPTNGNCDCTIEGRKCEPFGSCYYFR